MKEFQVNNYITLKLKNEQTYIYVGGEEFKQCKSLVLNIDLEDAYKYDQINSIDEVVVESFRDIQDINPEEEFKGHSSNLQTWAENSYDTRILHSNLAFPLLKKLVLLGDSIAKKVFKEEIATKFLSGYPPSLYILFEGRYMRFLSKDEFISLIPQLYINLTRFKENGEYLDILFWIVHEFKYLKLFDTPDSIVEEFILHILLDIKDNYEDWESWIHDLIRSIKAKPMMTLLLPTILTTLKRFPDFEKIEIFITLLINIKNSHLIQQFFGLIDDLFQEVMKRLFKIKTIYDQAHILADLFEAIDNTPLLTLHPDSISQYIDHLFNCFNPKFIYANESAIKRIRDVITNMYESSLKTAFLIQFKNKDLENFTVNEELRKISNKKKEEDDIERIGCKDCGSEDIRILNQSPAVFYCNECSVVWKCSEMEISSNE